MKKLFSVLAIAMVAFAAFAFTPKGDAFDNTYSFVEGQWVEGGGGNCQGGTQTCRFTSSAALTPAQRAEAAAQIAANPSRTTVTVTGIANPVPVSSFAFRP